MKPKDTKKTNVANQVQIIRGDSKLHRRYFVNIKYNPTNLASRTIKIGSKKLIYGSMDQNFFGEVKTSE